MLAFIQHEINILRTALLFYTRIPVGHIKSYESSMLHRATRYFPLVGIIVGCIGAGTFLLANLALPLEIALLLSIVLTIWSTGAFHEDGFADMCDGFGGGYTPEKVLDIMKDSRNGTYGTTGLILILTLKFFALKSLPLPQIALAMIAAHSFSRLFSVLLIYSSSYVRLDALSKAKPIGEKGSYSTLFLAGVFAVAPLFFLPLNAVVLASVVMLLVLVIFRNYTHRILGGYTGDVLGALQQISEVVFYLCLVAASNLFAL